MHTYTHRPLPVFALQYTGDNAEEIAREFSNRLALFEEEPIKNGRFFMVENSGYYVISVGDYIIRDASGNISVMGEKEFEERYDASAS